MTLLVTSHSRPTPWLKHISLEMTPPSLKDNTADVDRVLKRLKREIQSDRVFVDYSLWSKVPQMLRDSQYRVGITAFEWQGDWHVINVSPSLENQTLHGIAMDLGTSTVVLRLLDLTSGNTLSERIFPNPQIEIGTDILTRIHYASREEGLQRLHTLLIRRINEEIRAMLHGHHHFPRLHRRDFRSWQYDHEPFLPGA